jgi:hypothetical protein
MTTKVIATVIDGMLNPDEALSVADGMRVRLTIEPIVERPDLMEARQSLKAWIEELPLHGLGCHVTRDELHERR